MKTDITSPIWIIIFYCLSTKLCIQLDLKGPIFATTPPLKTHFSNDTGGKVTCIAHGVPQPIIEWMLPDGRKADTIPGLRTVHSNGSLIFLPFKEEQYRADIHSREYRCRARNSVGQIISKPIKVNAVVRQRYDVQVYDETAIVGNTAVLTCIVPSSITEYIMVSSWIQDGSVVIQPNAYTAADKYVMLDRDLYIYNVTTSDSNNIFTCRTLHKLTSYVQDSSYPARITVLEPDGLTPPKLLVERQSRKRVTVGDHITLSCIAQGVPIPRYRWFKEEKDDLLPVIMSKRINDDPSGLLLIAHAQITDQGKYVCIVNNSVAEDKVYISLIVSSSLSAQIYPQSQIIKINKGIEITCTISGAPIYKISWYHNGQLISNDRRIQITSNPEKLTISPTIKEDNGMYQCFVSNDWDVSQATAQLLLGDVGPEITQWFSEQTLQPGPPLSLKCVATGNPPPNFQWKLDDFPIPDSSRFIVGQYMTSQEEVVSHMNITSLKDEDGGEYSCSAYSSISQDYRSARINVYGLPYIRPMSRITAISGNKLIVKCPAAGYPIETITWEQGGVLLPVNRRQRVYPNGTLVIDQVQKSSDAGTYTCQAQNRQKHSARRDVEVQVLIPPKIMPIAPMTNLLEEGMRAALSCQVIEGDLPINFHWEKHGSTGKKLDVGATTRRIDEYSSSLIIEKITPSHTGNYTCVAENNAGQQTFTIPVVVNVPPRWVVEPKDTSISAGNDVILHCQADGHPPPTIIWKKAIGFNPGEYKDFLYEPNVNIFQNGSLQFLRTTRESEGHYMCEAKNEIGTEISKVIFLKVNSPAHFPQKMKQLNLLKGDQAHLQCNALGDNPMDITWKGSKGQIITSDLDSRYTIREQTLDTGKLSELGISKLFRYDTGMYSCIAKNNYGHDEIAIQLTVQEVPEAPRNLKVVERSSRTITIAWTQPYTGNSPITNYIVESKLISESWNLKSSKMVVAGPHTMTVIENLSPASSYHVRIIAQNNIGSSEPGEMMQFTTHEEVPGGAPKNVKIVSKSSTELVVSWEAPSRDLWNGNLLGYNIGYQDINDVNVSVNPYQHYTMKTADVDAEFGGEFIITNLNMYTSYNVIVQAFNSKGAGPFSDPVTARTDEGAPSMPPENVNCTPLTSQSVQITWEPPPSDAQNGIIKGYRVLYRPSEDWYEGDEYSLKQTSSLLATISGLLKYTNYSFEVVAHTKAGEGVKSFPIYCRTEEDVPSAPANIKAYPSSINKIIVSWLPPENNNGQLIGYTFYMAIRSAGKENGTHKRTLSEKTLSHETVRLQNNATYQFWVTASTRIGEGESTRVVTVPPFSKVPARIISFSQEIVTPWKRNVSLECMRIGIPTPKLIWKKKEAVVVSSDRYQISREGVLRISEVQKSDENNYTCIVENLNGRDEITYQLRIRVPPDPPQLTVIHEDTESLQLTWRDPPEMDIPILGYVINYKREHGDWEEIQIEAKTDTHVLHNLWCGTRYQLYMTAFNKIGTGLPCDIVTAYTKGSVPLAPAGVQEGVTYNTSSVNVWLDMWNDGGCSILYFIVQHKKESDSDWLTSKTASPADRIYTISELSPATRYQLKVTAHNNIGSSIIVYNFTTLSEDGGDNMIPVEFITPAPDSLNDFMLSPLTSIISIVILIIILTGVITTICYMKRKGEGIRRNLSGSNLDEIDKDEFRVKGSHSRQTLNADAATSCKTDSTEYAEEICPYATFEIARSGYGENAFRSSVYGPYSQQSFVYNDSNLPLKNKQGKDYDYTKVRSGRQREQEESDNLGSTDSEVKRILSLHMPISEYDTLRSDSEFEGRASVVPCQEMTSFRGNMSRDDSSSSSDASPSAPRAQLPLPHRRKGGQVYKKKSAKSSSGYSSHADEPAFSLSERIKPPIRFLDSRPKSRGVAKESSSDARRSSRNRLTQETSFQIDV